MNGEAAFGNQAVSLDDANTDADLPDCRAAGTNIRALPIFALRTFDGGNIVPSLAAKDARAAGLGLIAFYANRMKLC